jgi:hypothetical protein
MAANPNWARWMFSSVAYELKLVATNTNLAALVEHLDERTDAFMEAPDRVEIRITGPFDQEISKGFHRSILDANVLLTSIYGGQKKNALDILKYAGLFQARMGLPIPVYNYGTEVGEFNDPDLMTRQQVFIGCLLPIGGKNNSIKVFNFGQTDKVDKLKQSVVDARYIIELEE